MAIDNEKKFNPIAIQIRKLGVLDTWVYDILRDGELLFTCDTPQDAQKARDEIERLELKVEAINRAVFGRDQS